MLCGKPCFEVILIYIFLFRSAVKREDGEQEFLSSTGNEVLLKCGKIFSAILSCLAKVSPSGGHGLLMGVAY